MKRENSLPKHSPILRGIHEIASASEPTPRMDEVKTIITLRSGKKVKQPVPKPVEETKEQKEVEPEQIIIKEEYASSISSSIKR